MWGVILGVGSQHPEVPHLQPPGPSAQKQAAKKFRNEQEYLAQRRRGAESIKKIEHLFNSDLCASASLREIVNFFSRSQPREPRPAKVEGRKKITHKAAKLLKTNGTMTQ